ncbi:MAG: OmpA family protein [Polyangiales bacterium]
MVRSITIGALAMMMAFNISCTKTAKGGVIGGVGGGALGAGIGAIVGGGKGAAIGAAIGTAVGATTGTVVGHYMDKKEKKLREEMAQKAEIDRVGDELIVKFESGILFDTGKSTLRGDAKTALAEFAGVLKEYPMTDLRIEGHTDSDGSEKYNLKLSTARAKQVYDYLVAQGVASNRMASEGYGEANPVADNSTADGKQKNRRVEVKIVPNEELKHESEEAAAAAAAEQG